MALIKDGRLADDPWRHVDDDETLPADGAVIVGYRRWRDDGEALRGRNSPIGVRLASDESLELVAGDLDRLAVVALVFATFTDGRAYSQARILRQRHGYSGEVRAIGQVLRDQFQFMIRCGFDAFEITDGDPIDSWTAALSEIDLFYQPAADSSPTVATLRERSNDTEDANSGLAL